MFVGWNKPFQTFLDSSHISSTDFEFLCSQFEWNFWELALFCSHFHLVFFLHHQLPSKIKSIHTVTTCEWYMPKNTQGSSQSKMAQFWVKHSYIEISIPVFQNASFFMSWSNDQYHLKNGNTFSLHCFKMALFSFGV